eukprot:CAMPEP_0204437478 /NCGR_PEP_ID=MMETSP0470-20130426/77460_1 /ASSEMBLY_ACC=CAM_ASM_000385 /TAXON_ID=2969 /ORGANISM="Oxyrrhis marina" /LENGTH=282 /DNA_ID=CAMNT_0051436209 /DNA_START=1 /DNA_END=846 /DNA_ORIENTATION=+
MMNYKRLKVVLRKVDLRSHLPKLVQSHLPEMVHGFVLVDGQQYEFGTSGFLFQGVPGLGSAADVTCNDVDLGYTLRTHTEIEQKWREDKKRFPVEYDPLSSNCNHFSARLVQFLLGHVAEEAQVPSVASSELVQQVLNAWWLPAFRMMCPQTVEMCERYAAEVEREEEMFRQKRRNAIIGSCAVVTSPTDFPRVAKILRVEGDNLKLRTWAVDFGGNGQVEEEFPEIEESIKVVQLESDRVPLPSDGKTPQFFEAPLLPLLHSHPRVLQLQVEAKSLRPSCR